MIDNLKKIAFEHIARELHRDRVEGMQRKHAERSFPEWVSLVRSDPELAKRVGLGWLLDE